MDVSGEALLLRWQAKPRAPPGEVSMSGIRQQRKAEWDALYGAMQGELQAPLDLVPGEWVPQEVVGRLKGLQEVVCRVVPYGKGHAPGKVRHNGGRVFVWDGATAHERLVTVHLEQSKIFQAIHHCPGFVNKEEYEEVLNALDQAWQALQPTDSAQQLMAHS